jgi:hypothetical protein
MICYVHINSQGIKMKKILWILIVAFIVVSPMMASKAKSTPKEEKRVGVGMDVLNGSDALRVSIDGLSKGVRLDIRVEYARTTTNSGLGFGVGGYYDLSEYISVGGFFDTRGANLAGGTSATNVGAVLKAEKEFLKDFSLGVEFGYVNVSTSAASVLGKYSAVTARIYF